MLSINGIYDGKKIKPLKKKLLESRREDKDLEESKWEK